MNNHIICILLKWTIRKIVFHPFIKCNVKKDVGKNRTDYPTLRRPLFIISDEGSVLLLNGGFQPSLCIGYDVAFIGKIPQSPYHQSMVNVIKESFDVHVYNPCITPAIFSCFPNGLMSIAVWSITIGIFTEPRLSEWFQLFGYNHLGYPVPYGRYTQLSLTPTSFGYLMLSYSRRMETSACKTVPYRVQVFPGKSLDVLDGDAINSGGFALPSYMFKRFPYLFFGNGIRFWSFVQIHPFKLFNLKLIQQLTRLCQSLRSAPITGVSSLLRTNPPLIPGIGTLRLTLRSRAYIILPWHPGFSFPCSVIEPGIKSYHLYAGCPSWSLAGILLVSMTCLFGSLTPRILSNNSVSYDASAVVYSHLIYLFIPHLTESVYE